jgi:hypothetical protein
MLKKQLQKMDRLSDRQLVDLLLANDEAAVEYVFFHRCDGLFARVLGSFPSHQAQKKEELITDFYLFLRADDWRRLRQFSFRSELNTWMTVVAIRFFNQKITPSQTNTSCLDAPLNQGVNQIPDDFDLFDQLSKVELYEAIERLPKPRERFALLGELAGKKAETIAEELGCSVMAVYNLTKKAKMALKKKMKGGTK